MGKTYPRVTELLKREFEEKGVTKYTFCKQTGINPTSVERYLCGISEPNQASLEKLADYFKVSVAYLRGATLWDLDVEEEVHGLYLKFYAERADLRFSLSNIMLWISFNINDCKYLLDDPEKEEMEKLAEGVKKYLPLCAALINIKPEEREDALEVLLHFYRNINKVEKCSEKLRVIQPSEKE